MELAAEERFLDGLILSFEPGREAGAIYLFGYVAELLLKTAYSRAVGKLPTERPYDFLSGDVTASGFIWQGAKSAKGLPVLHSLKGLAEFLIDTRGYDLDTGVATEPRRRIDIVEQHWDVSMRYADFPATQAEMSEVYASIDWLRTNYDDLWS